MKNCECGPPPTREFLGSHRDLLKITPLNIMKSMIKRLLGILCFILEAEAGSFPTYVTDGTNSSPPGNVYSIDTSTNSATNTVSNSLSPPFSRPLGVALSPGGTFAYVSDWDTGQVYYIDVPSNTATQLVSSGFSSPNGLAISSDSAFAYLADYEGGVYRIDVATNSATLTTNSLGDFNGPIVPAISLDATFAYVTNISTPAVFRIDPITNAATAQVDGSFQYPVGITIATDGTKAYVADSVAIAIFSIDTTTNVATKFTSPSFQTPYGVAVSTDGKTLYIADPGAQSVFYFDTTTNQITRTIDISCTAPHWAISPIAISPDGLSLYVAGGNTANIWHIDIDSGVATEVTNATESPYKSPTSAATLPPLISTGNLSGNNLRTANYLNVNQPYIVLRQIVPFQETPLNRILEMVAPTRNAFATFASQITQVSLSRLVNDHQRQNRRKQKNGAASLVASNDLIANSYQETEHTKKNDSAASADSPPNDSLWIGAFGQYAHENGQHQTPAFSMSSGGGVLAWDFRGASPSLFGIGAAYAYTHLHEKSGFGQANIQQGDLFFYGTFPISNWYFDGAVWGSYYQLHNQRKIVFPGVDATASLSTHGWQCTPHVEMGYGYRFHSFEVDPFAMVDWVNCWEQRATETGASGFNMHQKGRYCSLLRAETGIRFEEVCSFEWGTMTWMEKISYAYQKTFHTGTISAFLVGSPNSFTVSTLTGAQNLGVAELNVLFDPRNKAYPYASLSGHVELGGEYQSYQGMIELGKKF